MRVTYWVGTGTAESTTAADMAVADVNGDGRPDLAVVDSGGMVTALLNVCLP